jgi:ArsR family transcriptional regulator, arsenate/arsenite/antimonite-responsive transcriptional repressor
MAERDPAAHLRFAFVRDGRLTSLPRREALLAAACAFLADRFEPGRRYSEREVNELLADDAPDPATLRRLMVDHGLLARGGGEYWRVT